MLLPVIDYNDFFDLLYCLTIVKTMVFINRLRANKNIYSAKLQYLN